MALPETGDLSPLDTGSHGLLDRLAEEARDSAVNLMPTTIELVKARATLGEIVARLRDVFGRYVEKPVF